MVLHWRQSDICTVCIHELTHDAISPAATDRKRIQEEKQTFFVISLSFSTLFFGFLEAGPPLGPLLMHSRLLVFISLSALLPVASVVVSCLSTLGGFVFFFLFFYDKGALWVLVFRI